MISVKKEPRSFADRTHKQRTGVGDVGGASGGDDDPRRACEGGERGGAVGPDRCAGSGKGGGGARAGGHSAEAVVVRVRCPGGQAGADRVRLKSKGTPQV